LGEQPWRAKAGEPRQVGQREERQGSSCTRQAVLEALEDCERGEGQCER
jgi:hypothetical protein